MAGISDFICSFILLLVSHVFAMPNKAIDNL